LRRLQSGLQAAGLAIADSYVSITEVSEYAKGMPAEMLKPRLYPVLPPEGKNAFCFYPMSKRREQGANWYSLPFDERTMLMHEHGTSGRKFAGRIVQLITASTGLDEHEWGVTLFGNHTDDLKDVVYTMRFDRASAIFADFGHFYVGMITPAEQLFAG
jgi:peroxiredoxin